MDKSPKPKRGLSNIDKVWPGYLALIIALGVCLFLLVSGNAVVHFPDENGTPIFYPLVVVMHLSSYAPYFWGVMLLLLTGLVVVALFRRVMILAPLFVFLLSWGVVGYSVLTMSGDPKDFKLYQTVSYADYSYHLLQTWDMTVSEQTIYTYTIVKCDSLSLICHYFSTPHRISTRLDGASAFDQSGLLFIDESANNLNLRVGAEVYSIDPWADRPW